MCVGVLMFEDVSTDVTTGRGGWFRRGGASAAWTARVGRLRVCGDGKGVSVEGCAEGLEGCGEAFLVLAAGLGEPGLASASALDGLGGLADHLGSA